MRIYKGEAGVNITLENFLDLLEEDALEEIIDMVLDLELTGSISGHSIMGDFDGDFGDEIVYLGVLQLPEEFDGDFEALLESNEEFANLLDYLTEDAEYFKDINEEEVMDNFLCSNEDLKVKRIVQRFRHVLDASK